MVVWTWPNLLSLVRAVRFRVSRGSLLAVALSSFDPSSYTCSFRGRFAVLNAIRIPLVNPLMAFKRNAQSGHFNRRAIGQPRANAAARTAQHTAGLSILTRSNRKTSRRGCCVVALLWVSACSGCLGSCRFNARRACLSSCCMSRTQQSISAQHTSTWTCFSPCTAHCMVGLMGI